MAVYLDHVIVSTRDRDASATRLAHLLDVPCGPAREGPFFAVYINDGLTFDFIETEEAYPVEHFCFASTTPLSMPSWHGSRRPASLTAAAYAAPSTIRSTPATAAR